MAEHEGLKNLYNQVVSGSFGWERWGLLSVLSDYVLYYTEGDILEIGCGESSIILSKLAEKYNRICYHCEFSKSGVQNMKNTKGYFGKNSKVFNMKSDEFFSSLKNADIGYTKLALAFIDGDHSYSQVQKDFYNTFEYVVKDGYIFLHDTYPPNESWTSLNRCGTVYKLREDLEKRSDIEIFTFTKSAFDVGLTMLQKNHG
jgi:hypothetical protein